MLGQYCGSSAMIYAMHKIQVACVVHHAQQSAYFQNYLRELVEQQRLMASATTEIGVGGDLRSQPLRRRSRRRPFRLTKKAPVISYGEAADDILVTCRKSAGRAGQRSGARVGAARRFQAEPLSTWDTLGFRGTCSSGFTLTARGAPSRSCRRRSPTFSRRRCTRIRISCGARFGPALPPTPSIGRGLAFAPRRARPRAKRRSPPFAWPKSIDVLQEMRHNVASLHPANITIAGRRARPEAFHGFGFSIRTNNLKLVALAADRRYRRPGDADLRHRRLSQRFEIQPVAPPARCLRRGPDGQQRPHHETNATMLMAHREG